MLVVSPRPAVRHRVTEPKRGGCMLNPLFLHQQLMKATKISPQNYPHSSNNWRDWQESLGQENFNHPSKHTSQSLNFSCSWFFQSLFLGSFCSSHKKIFIQRAAADMLFQQGLVSVIHSRPFHVEPSVSWIGFVLVLHIPLFTLKKHIQLDQKSDPEGIKFSFQFTSL